MDNYQDSLSIKKGVRQGYPPLSPILFDLFINAIFNNGDNYGISIGDSTYSIKGFLKECLYFLSLRNEMLFSAIVIRQVFVLCTSSWIY